VLLLLGILANALCHVIWWVRTISTSYINHQRTDMAMKTWQSATRVGNVSSSNTSMD
jgi:hypothetical protein